MLIVKLGKVPVFDIPMTYENETISLTRIDGEIYVTIPQLVKLLNVDDQNIRYHFEAYYAELEADPDREVHVLYSINVDKPNARGGRRHSYGNRPITFHKLTTFLELANRIKGYRRFQPIVVWLIQINKLLEVKNESKDRLLKPNTKDYHIRYMFQPTNVK